MFGVQRADVSTRCSSHPQIDVTDVSWCGMEFETTLIPYNNGHLSIDSL